MFDRSGMSDRRRERALRLKRTLHWCTAYRGWLGNRPLVDIVHIQFPVPFPQSPPEHRERIAQVKPWTSTGLCIGFPTNRNGGDNHDSLGQGKIIGDGQVDLGDMAQRRNFFQLAQGATRQTHAGLASW